MPEHKGAGSDGREGMARAYLFDLDGTLVAGGRPVPGAAALLARLAGRFCIVSNDAEHTPQGLSCLLRQRGLEVAPEEIVLAGTAAIETVARERRKARLMLLGSEALASHAVDRGLVVTDREPDCVVLARDRQFSFERLMRAANAVRAGADLVVANPDLTHPLSADMIVPETGALLAALLACTGPVPYRVIGKPRPALFADALARLGVAAHEATMIGDNPQTDGVGAKSLGIGFLQVRDGELPDVDDEAGLAAAIAAPVARPAMTR